MKRFAAIFSSLLLAASAYANWVPGTYTPRSGRQDLLTVVVPWEGSYAVDGMTSGQWARLPAAQQFAWALQCTLTYDQIVAALAWTPKFLTAIEQQRGSGTAWWVVGAPAMSGYSQTYTCADGTVVYFLQGILSDTPLDYSRAPIYDFVYRQNITFSLAEGYGTHYQESTFTPQYMSVVINQTESAASSFMQQVRHYFDYQEAPPGLSFLDVFPNDAVYSGSTNVQGGVYAPQGTVTGLRLSTVPQYSSNSLAGSGSVIPPDYTSLMNSTLPTLDIWRSGVTFKTADRTVPYSARPGVYTPVNPSDTMVQFVWRGYSPINSDRGWGPTNDVSEGGLVLAAQSHQASAPIDLSPAMRLMQRFGLSRTNFPSERPDNVSLSDWQTMVTGIQAPVSQERTEAPFSPSANMPAAPVVDPTTFAWQANSSGGLGGSVQNANAKNSLPMSGKILTLSYGKNQQAVPNTLYLNDPRFHWVSSERMQDSLYSGDLRPPILFKQLAFLTQMQATPLATLQAAQAVGAGVLSQRRYGMFPLSALGYADFMNQASIRLPSGYYPKFVPTKPFSNSYVPKGLPLPDGSVKVPNSLSVSVPTMSYYSSVPGVPCLGDFAPVLITDAAGGVSVVSADSTNPVPTAVLSAIRDACGTLDYAGTHFVTLDLFILQNTVDLRFLTNAAPGLTIRYESPQGNPLMLHSGSTWGIPTPFSVSTVGTPVPRVTHTIPFRLSVISDSTVFVRGPIGIGNPALYAPYTSAGADVGVFPRNDPDLVLWFVPMSVTSAARAAHEVSVTYNVTELVPNGGYTQADGSEYVFVNGQPVRHRPYGGFHWQQVPVNFTAPVYSSAATVMAVAAVPFCSTIDPVPVATTHDLGQSLKTPYPTTVLAGNWVPPRVDPRIEIVSPDYVMVPSNYGGYW